jgi:hypothetical protein
MNAKEFFDEVVVKNFEVQRAHPAAFNKLWNAVVSMNTVAEFVALDQLKYGVLDGAEIDKQAAKIRNAHPILQDIKKCTETLKHVRRHYARRELIATSTGVDVDDPTSWELQEGGALYGLRATLEKAFQVVRQFPELR